MKDEAGATYFELLLVIAIIALVGALSTPFLNRFILQNSIFDVIDKFAVVLRKAQNYALCGKEGSQWGVHYETDSLTLFKGDSFGQDHAFDESYDIPGVIDISGWSDVTFSKVRGRPSVALTLTITSVSDTKTLILNQEGMVGVE